MSQEIKKSSRYCYIQVTSNSQEDNSSLESQIEELMKVEVLEKNIRVEVGSAADKIEDWPIFDHLIDHELKQNDLLIMKQKCLN